MRLAGLIIIVFSLVCCESAEVRKQRHLLVGNEALEKREHAQAIKSYQAALALDSCYADALNNWGTALFNQHQMAEAAEVYSRAIGCAPGFLPAYFNRANTWYALRQWDRAMHDINFITTVKPDTLPALLLKGMTKTKQRKFEEAALAFSQALHHHPDDAECAINLATVLYYQHAWDSAQRILEEVITRSGNQPNASNTLAMIHTSTGNHRKALVCVNQAITLKRDPYFLNNRGFVYLQLNWLDSALADINESIKMDVDNPWAYRNKGIYYLRTYDYPSAVRLLKQAVEMDPFVEDAYSYLAEALWQNQEKDAACNALQESIARGERRIANLPGCKITSITR